MIQINTIVEKPKPEVAPSRYAIIGRYVFDSSLFDALRDTQPGIGGEIQLTDAMDKLCAEGKLHGVLLKGCRYDIGNPLYYLKAQIDLALRRPELSQSLRDYMKSL